MSGHFFPAAGAFQICAHRAAHFSGKAAVIFSLAERPDPALKIIFLILLTKHFPKFRFIHPAVAILMNNML